MNNNELIEMISRYGDMRHLVALENEQGSPQRADEIEREAYTLLATIKSVVAKLRPVMSDKFSS